MSNKSVVDPNKFINYLKENGYLSKCVPPKIVIVVFLESLLNYCKEKYPLKKIEGFDAGELFLLEDNSSVAIFFCKGIGAPVAVINLEELIAYGVSNFIVVGSAGAISPNLSIGDIVICNSALRDEGTSRHYIDKGTISSPTESWTKEIKVHLSEKVAEVHEGGTWTTDAPYRETESKVVDLQNKGYLCVEMEASAMFTVADFYNVSIAALFAISDSLADLQWTPGFFSIKVSDSLHELIDFCLEFSVKAEANV
ncbi:nucleoside phosphorylase [Xenorhabdus budapestensis]|uniref:Uridine phosphorylase n=1 Tax=Xenorhabdus budapestensis TaxID=290110 RepID=A0ABX7VLH9_XENBU|nr:nucleoside phosphorylase [Xenorhabdus budapestensis]QTL40385.1 nucleoside phosphorylase [Xenorhabdus budapestensis]